MIDDDSDASPKKRPQHRHDSSDSDDDASPPTEQPQRATTARVVVDVTRARDLSEEHGLPNPFCVLSIVQLRDGRRLSDARRTRVAKHTSNPVWRRERFVFEAPISIKELPKLRIEVFSFRTLRKARLLGKAQVALNGLEDGDNEITVPIKLDTARTGEVCATIAMTPHDENHATVDADSVRWFVDEEAVAPCLHRAPNCLRVALVRCVELQKESKLQKLEHFVHTPHIKLTASLGDEKRETRNIDRTQSPLVMEAFDLPYDKGKDHQFLHVEVNHNLGVARFPVDELPSPHEDDGAAAAMWLTLLKGEQAVGKVRIAAKLSYVAGLDPQHQDLVLDDSQDTQHPNEIRVAVCRARDLHPGTWDSCDAYVSLRLNDPLSLTHRTQTVLKTTHPVFNEIFAFEFHGEGHLELDVYDWHWTQDDELLGSCAVSLEKHSREWRTLEHGALLIAIQKRHNPIYVYEPFAGDLHFRNHEPNTLMIGAHKVRIANHIADFQPMFRCEFRVPHADVVRTRDKGLRAGFIVFREVLSLEIKEDCVLECSVPGVGKGTYDITPLKSRRARDERIDLYDGSTLTGRLHVRLAWRFDPGLDYAPFAPEPVRTKAEVANQLKIALVQASGLTEGSPLVVFEVSSSDKIMHRWRSQERKKTPHPVWHQQWAVSLDANVASPLLKARLEDVSRGELMGHALINLTSLLDRKIHRGWHKLVGEATDVNETVTVELGGEIELIVQWCHSPATVAQVVPPTTPKPAKPSPSGISAGISGSTQKKVFFGVAAAGMAAAAGARARRRAAARAVPELAEIEKDAAPAATTEEDEEEASLDLVEDYTYVNPFDVHRFWNREVFVVPPGEQCARWQLRRVRLATEVATGFPFLLHGVPAPLESAIPYASASAETPSTRYAIVATLHAIRERRYLDEKRFSLRRAHLCDVRVCRFEGRDHVVRLASAAREGPRLLQKVSDCRVCCESQEEAWAVRRAILGKAHGGKQLPVDNDEDRAAAELCRAAGAGDLERVEELLASGEATAEDANGAGESAVSRAVRFAIQTARGRDRLQMARALKCVAVLMEKGADPFAASCLGASARDVLEAARGEVPDAIIDTIRKELDRAAIVATADGGSLLALTGPDAARARELIRRREARESRARRYEDTGWTAEDERLEAEDNAEADAADPLYGVKLRRYPRHGVAAVFSSENGPDTKRQDRRALEARYRIRQAVEIHADPAKDPRRNLGFTDYKGPTLTGNKEADAVRLLFHNDDVTSVESGPRSIEDSIVLKRPGSAPAKRTTAKRLDVTPLKRRPQSATVGKPATELHGLEEINVHETHLEPQLRRIRGLLEADAQRGKPTFIKQNLHLPPTRGRLHKLAFKAGRPPRPDKRSINLARAAAAATSQKKQSLLGTRPASAGALRPSSASAVRPRPSSASVARPSSATVARPASATATSRRRRVGPTKAAPRHTPARPRSAPARRRPVAPPPNWSTNWSKTWAKPIPSSRSSGDLFL